MIPEYLLTDVLEVERFEASGSVDDLGEPLGDWELVEEIRARTEDTGITVLEDNRYVKISGKRAFFNRGDVVEGDRVKLGEDRFSVKAKYHRRLGPRGFFRIDLLRVS